MSEGQGSITYSGPASGSGNLPGVTVPFIDFAVGDGQPGSPVDGDTTLIATTLQGQNIVNKQLLVIREGVQLLYNTAVDTNQIRRYNTGGQGGFSFESGEGPGAFFNGERYQIFITGTNNTDEA